MFEPVMWQAEWSVGVEAMDAQHQELLRLINRMASAQVAPAQLVEAMGDILEYATTHFQAEEQWLSIRAPAMLPHQQSSHAAFNTQAFEFASRLGDFNTESLRHDVHDFLSRWLVEHIQTEDQLYNPRSSRVKDDAR